MYRCPFRFGVGIQEYFNLFCLRLLSSPVDFFKKQYERTYNFFSNQENEYESSVFISISTVITYN